MGGNGPLTVHAIDLLHPEVVKSDPAVVGSVQLGLRFADCSPDLIETRLR